MEKKQNIITYPVTLMRVHKGSPYNVTGYIPAVKAATQEEVVDMKEVQDMIKKAFGKKFILQVDSSNTTEFLRYEITKSKARGCNTLIL